MNTIQATKAYLEAREALEVAEKAKAQAEALLKEALAKAGTSFSIVEGVKVSIVQGERPNYDAEALRDLVSPNLFRKVTKATVDTKKFRSAVELGSITPEVAEAVTKVTPYEQVRVTEVAGEAKAQDEARKVA